ncbi:hypothetical protein TrLO_g3937 [Triparma laevis f. longispina]|uniref:Uncharacterized protein n=1 Tax=Triparma laevis f. longispina TaxID=1714387 RepID=A0A9W7AMG6_9STRA|nr:hypothetical protein TrLO_g3937 [Triparma laevis f. longispina]
MIYNFFVLVTLFLLLTVSARDPGRDDDGYVIERDVVEEDQRALRYYKKRNGYHYQKRNNHYPYSPRYPPSTPKPSPAPPTVSPTEINGGTDEPTPSPTEINGGTDEPTPSPTDINGETDGPTEIYPARTDSNTPSPEEGGVKKGYSRMFRKYGGR